MSISPCAINTLESESIETFRETAATFRNSVMLYCTGKDSSLTAGIESSATAIEEVVNEVTELKLSEKANRIIASDKGGSIGKKETEGYS